MICVQGYDLAMAFRKFSVGLSLGPLNISGDWEPDEAEQNAAWEMYVELTTRISVSELRPGEGVLREALTSLYSLFATTRDILRRYGPGIARGKQEGALSFGYIAVAVLNGALRPTLAVWHPALSSHEISRPSNVAPVDHELTWDRSDELRAELNRVRLVLVEYAHLLADVVGAPSLLQAVRDTERT